jgi:peptidoglycan-N-acetylglucosamine deacetylase
MNHPINRREFLGTAAAAVTLPAGVAAALGPTLPQPTTWPGDRSAAVSLTFDDAMQTQLDNAGPILKEHGLKGTFFVITGPLNSWRRRFSDWEHLAAEGNEIGSHTIHHPCMLKDIEIHSQTYTPEMMLKEIRDSSQDIIARLGAPRGLTFAYPCGDMTFGSQDQLARNQARYLDYVAEYYFAARGYNSWAPVVADDLNPLTIPVLGWTFGRDFSDLLKMLEPARLGHHWGVFVFHGVGGQWLSVKNQTLDELAGYLEQHSEVWTGTFGDVVRYIQEIKALKIQAGQSLANRFEFDLTWPLDAKIYDLPATLKWSLPPQWRACSAEGDGRALKCSVTVKAGARTALVDVPAQTKTLRFVES